MSALSDCSVALLLGGLHVPPELGGEMFRAADVDLVLAFMQGHLQIGALLNQLAMGI